MNQDAALEVRIAPTGSVRYAFFAAARNANLTGIGNPVPATLTSGNGGGTTLVTAEISD